MKIKLLFFFFLLFALSLSAKEYPQTFSTLGTPLYSCVKPFQKYKNIEDLNQSIVYFEKLANATLQDGYNVDKKLNVKLTKTYLKELRTLQKEYDKLLHKLHKCIQKSIKSNDYNSFIRLTSYDFDGLLENRNLQNSAISFYSKNRVKKQCTVLDKKMKNTKLINDTQELFRAEIIESTYNSKSNKKSKKRVQISALRVENKIQIMFENLNIYPVTIKVIPFYKNIKAEQNHANEFVLKAKSKIKYATLQILNGQSYYNYKFSWTMGSKDAVHNDKYIYRLPYKIGTSHMVSQGYNGTKTHKGRSAYSIDFPMPKGTKIYASRDGIVVKTKSNSDVGGYERKYASSGNFVRILHDDGTFATYYHLQYKGVLVKVGDKISKGESIGLSGNTGYSSGPHLHFSVFKAESYNTRQTVAVTISSTEGVITNPKVGHYYKAK